MRQRIEFDARQIDATERGMPLCQFGGRHEHFRGRQDRSRRIVTALVVARLDFREGLRRQRFDLVVGRDQRICRQVVEQCGAGVEEQRQVVLDAWRRRTFRDVLIDRHPRQIAREAIAEAALECLDAFGRQREFARGQQSQRR